MMIIIIIIKLLAVNQARIRPGTLLDCKCARCAAAAVVARFLRNQFAASLKQLKQRFVARVPMESHSKLSENAWSHSSQHSSVVHNHCRPETGPSIQPTGDDDA